MSQQVLWNLYKLEISPRQLKKCLKICHLNSKIQETKVFFSKSSRFLSRSYSHLAGDRKNATSTRWYDDRQNDAWTDGLALFLCARLAVTAAVHCVVVALFCHREAASRNPPTTLHTGSKVISVPDFAFSLYFFALLTITHLSTPHFAEGCVVPSLILVSS